MEEHQTIVGGSNSSSDSGITTAATAATIATTTTTTTSNNPTKMTSPLSTVYQPPTSTSASSPFSNNNPTPMTPNTPSNASRLWNPARGIIFTPSPITPVSPFTTPLSRSFHIKSASKSPLDTPTSSSTAPSNIDSDSTSGVLGSPTITKVAIPRKRHSRGLDWAGLMGLTEDGKEKETVPAGFDVFQQDTIADATEESADTPLDDVRALQDAIDAVAAEEAEGDLTTAAALEDEEVAAAAAEDEGQYEDPGIERVKTPEGIEVIMWKKKPLVYTDEKDPYVAPDYLVSEEALQAAVEANENFNMNRYVNSEGKPPTIHYVTDVDEMEEVSKLFEGNKAIGFDMEWQPNAYLKPTTSDRDIRNCTSVIQIANQERVAIFHLAKFPPATKRFMSPTLKKIIEDPGIVKTGVCIKGDISRLSLLINVNPAGILDLADFNSNVFAAEGGELPPGKRLPTSLTHLCKEHLKLPLDKGEVRTSSWSKALNDEQKLYAANDAYACYRIYDAIDRRRRALDRRPAIPPLHAQTHEETVEAYYKRKAAAKKAEETPRKPSVIRVPKDAGPQLVRAYDWVKEYAKSKPDGILATGAANLRCYALWHHQALDVEDTAAACRDPPLGTAYVAQCILEAILVEKLPYQAGRVLWVMRDLSKEAMGRFYQLKAEAMQQYKQEKEEQAAAAAKAKATVQAAVAKSRERGGWDTGEGDSSSQSGRDPRRTGFRSLRGSKSADELFSARFESSNSSWPRQKKLKEEGEHDEPQIRYHESFPSLRIRTVGTELSPLVRKTVGVSTYRNDVGEGSESNAPAMQRSVRSSSPTATAYRRPLLSNISATTAPTISFDSSGELGEILGGFDRSAVRLKEGEGEEDTSSDSLGSKVNTPPKRTVWIGVPSRRRKSDP